MTGSQPSIVKRKANDENACGSSHKGKRQKKCWHMNEAPPAHVDITDEDPTASLAGPSAMHPHATSLTMPASLSADSELSTTHPRPTPRPITQSPLSIALSHPTQTSATEMPTEPTEEAVVGNGSKSHDIASAVLDNPISNFIWIISLLLSWNDFRAQPAQTAGVISKPRTWRQWQLSTGPSRSSQDGNRRLRSHGLGDAKGLVE